MQCEAKQCTCPDGVGGSVGTKRARGQLAVLKLNQMLMRDLTGPEMVNPEAPKGVLAAEALQVIRKLTDCDQCVRTLYDDLNEMLRAVPDMVSQWPRGGREASSGNPAPFFDSLSTGDVHQMNGEPLRIVAAARLFLLWARLFTTTGDAGPNAPTPITGMHLLFAYRGIRPRVRVYHERQVMDGTALAQITPKVFVHRTACHQEGSAPTHFDADAEEQSRAFGGATYVTDGVDTPTTSAVLEQMYAHETRFFGASSSEIPDAEREAFAASMFTYGVVIFDDDTRPLVDLGAAMQTHITAQDHGSTDVAAHAAQVFFGVNVFAGATLRAYEATYRKLTSV